MGLPHGGTWREVLNSDAEHYGGSNIGNGGAVHADGEALPRPAAFRLALTLPPLGAILLRHEGNAA